MFHTMDTPGDIAGRSTQYNDYPVTCLPTGCHFRLKVPGQGYTFCIFIPGQGYTFCVVILGEIRLLSHYKITLSYHRALAAPKGFTTKIANRGCTWLSAWHLTMSNMNMKKVKNRLIKNMQRISPSYVLPGYLVFLDDLRVVLSFLHTVSYDKIGTMVWKKWHCVEWYLVLWLVISSGISRQAWAGFPNRRGAFNIRTVAGIIFFQHWFPCKILSKCIEYICLPFIYCGDPFEM